MPAAFCPAPRFPTAASLARPTGQKCAATVASTETARFLSTRASTSSPSRVRRLATKLFPLSLASSPVRIRVARRAGASAARRTALSCAADASEVHGVRKEHYIRDFLPSAVELAPLPWHSLFCVTAGTSLATPRQCQLASTRPQNLAWHQAVLSTTTMVSSHATLPLPLTWSRERRSACLPGPFQSSLLRPRQQEEQT